MAANVRPRDRSAIRARGGGSGIAGLASFAPDFFNNPTLVDPKTGLAISLTRATTATYTDQDLIVRTALAGMARMQGMRVVRNLVTGSSEDLTNGSWFTFGGATPTATTIAFAATATNSVYQQTLATATGSVNRIFLVRLLASHATSTKLFRLRITHSGVLDYTSGDLTATTTPQVFSFTATIASAGGTGLTVQIMNGSDAAAGTINCTKVQIEEVTGQSIQTPGEYQSVGVMSSPYQGLGVDGAKAYATLNGNTVASNVVTEATGAVISSSIRQGFLVEAAATNLCLQSADFATTWTLNAATVSTNAVAAPDGTTTADKIQEDNTTAQHGVIQTFVKAASAIAYSASFYAKQSERTWFAIQVDDTTQGARAWFNLASGVVGTVVGFGASPFTALTSTIQAAANGFYRCTISFTSSTSVTLRVVPSVSTGDTVLSYLGTTGSGIYLWGAQLETGSLATSYIPTTTVAVTRNADVATIATGSWYNALAGTLYAEWLNPSVSGAYRVASLNDGTTNNLIDLFVSSITVAGAQTVLSGGLQTNLFAATVTGGAVAKSVNVFKGSDFAGFANNATLGTSSSGTVPTVTRLEIGSSAGVFQLNSTIRAIRYYPVRLNNVTAQNLTV